MSLIGIEIHERGGEMKGIGGSVLDCGGVGSRVDMEGIRESDDFVLSYHG